MKYDSKTDTHENSLVTLAMKAMKAYSDPDPLVVAPTDAHQWMRLLVERGLTKKQRAAQKSYVQEARSNQKRQYFIEKINSYSQSCQSNPKIQKY